MKRLLLLLLFPIGAFAQCTGSSPTWTTTPDQASVQTCITNASAGDTINITAGSGSVTWTSAGMVLGGKPLSIIGPGQSALTINFSIPTGTSPTCNAFQSRTITNTTLLTRISGFTIQPGPGITSVCQAIVFQGTCTASTCPSMRIDHITFSGFATVSRNGGFAINITADMFGVWDHNTINGVSGNFLQLVEVHNASYLNSSAFNGDSSWTNPEKFGSQNFIVFEDNTFNTAGCCENEVGVGFSNVGGSRALMRFNTFNNMDQLNEAMTWHGTESLQRRRGGRAFEFYANTFTCVNGTKCNDVTNWRSGTGITWGNVINTNVTFNKLFNFGTFRTESAAAGWGTCDGSSPYDTNDTNGASGNTAFIYFTGTVGSVSTSGGTSTVTVSGASPGWTTGQWTPTGAPYSMRDTTQSKGTEILTNNANSFTVLNTGVPGAWTPAVNDAFQIQRAFVCLDPGAGRGQSTVLYNNVDPATPASPANEALSPAYFVANTQGGGGTLASYVSMFPPNGRNIRNRDWYQDNLNQAAQTSPTSPFDGTTTIGGGWGTLANRPTTCTTGVEYWAADQGTWNTANKAIPGTPGFTQGLLYTCTSPNTWTLKYTPLTYPHPLIIGPAPPPTCTLNIPIGVFTLCNQTYDNVSSSSALTINANPATGNGVEIIFPYCGNTSCSTAPTQTVTSISDNINSPEPCFVQAPHSPYTFVNSNVPDSEKIYVWYCPSIPAGVTSFTVSTNAAVNFPSIDLIEWKGGVIPSTGFFDPVDQTQNSGAVANTLASVSTSAAISSSSELITALVFNCGATIPAVVGNGYTGITVNPTAPNPTPGYITEAKAVTSTGVQTATTTWTSGTAPGNCSLGSSAPNDTWAGVIVPLSSVQLNGASLNPTSLTFANQLVGTTSAAQSFLLSNISSSTITISNITTAGDFAQTNNCGATLAPNASCTFNVTFTPTTTGIRTGSVTITSTATNSPTVESLSGTGFTSPTINGTNGSIVFNQQTGSWEIKGLDFRCNGATP